jgi:thiamine biosynthesis lipoprotein
MYTVVSITVFSDSKEKAERAIQKTFNELERIATLLNFYSKDSEISLINRKAGISPVKVSPETIEIIKKALYVSDNTEGAFDITIGPIVRLWDFQNKRLPDEKKLKEKIKVIGYKNILLDENNNTIFIKKKGVQIDLGGIIKGYAADKAVELLKSSGIEAGIVAIGGDIKTFGRRPDGIPWAIGIQNPRQKTKEDEIFALMRFFSEIAISTSGDYEKYFILNGVRYHHLLDPKTGYPSYESRSVTIVSNESALSDAFATGIFILGPEKGLKILERLNLEGVIISKDGKIFITEGLKEKIEFINYADKMPYM